MSILSFANFILLNLSLAASALLLTFRLNNYKISNYGKLTLHAFTFFVSQIIIIEIFLGIFGFLNIFSVSISIYALLALAIALFAKKTLKTLHLPKKLPKIKFFTIALIFSPLALLLILRAFTATLQIPLEYDSTSYHLPFVAQWLQSGSLTNIYYTAFSSPLGYYPGNYELLTFFSVLPFKNDFFVNLLNFPLFGFFAFTLYKIARNLKIHKKIALLLSVFLLYTPIFLHQAGYPLVDLFFALTFALTLYFLQEIHCLWQKKQTPTAELILFGLTLGLFVGTKYLGLLYGFIPGLIFLILLFKNKFSPKKYPKLKAIALTAIPALLAGAFFYIRNIIHSGNPFFPINFKLFGLTIFEGMQGINEKLSSLSLFHDFQDPLQIKLFFTELFGMTGPHILILFPVIIATALYSIYKIFSHKKSKKTIITGSLLTILSAIYFLLYIKSPYTASHLTQNMRYAMPFFMLGTLTLGFLVTKIKFLRPFFYFATVSSFAYSLIFLAITSSTSPLYNDKLLIDLSIISDNKPLLLAFITQLILIFIAFQVAFLRKIKYKLPLTIGLLIITLISFYPFANHAIQKREVLKYESIQTLYQKDEKLLNLAHSSFWLDDKTEQTNIAYAGFNFHYHLYGRNFENKVNYININDCQNCQYYEFRNSKDTIRTTPDYNQWLQNLQAKNINYLIVDPEFFPEIEIYEYTWATSHPEAFTEIYNKGSVHIFSLQPLGSVDESLKT